MSSAPTITDSQSRVLPIFCFQPTLPTVHILDRVQESPGTFYPACQYVLRAGVLWIQISIFIGQHGFRTNCVGCIKVFSRKFTNSLYFSLKICP